MRGAAAELGHHAGDTRQDLTEGRTGYLGDQNVTRGDPGQLAFAIDDDGTAGAPADACRMAVETGMPQPDRIGYVRLLHLQRPRLQQLESGLVQRPFDLD